MRCCFLCVVFLFAGNTLAISYQRPLVDIFNSGDTFFLECEPHFDATSLSNHLEDIHVQFIKEGAVIPTRDGLDSQNVAFTERTVLSEGRYVTQAVQEVAGSRYTLTRINATTHRYRLLIKDLRPEDSGYIGCQFISSISSQQDIQKYFCNITVIGPPSAIMLITYTADTLSYKKHLQNQSTFHLNASEVSPISCAVIYPNYRPSIRLYLTDTNFASSYREIGGHLEFSAPIMTVKKMDGPLTYVEFREERLSAGFTVNRTFHNKVLVCEAVDLHPAWLEVINVERIFVTLDVAYTPLMDCNQSVVTVHEPGLTEAVSCDVLSNPPSQTTWYSIPEMRDMDSSVVAVSVIAGTDGETSGIVIDVALNWDTPHLVIVITSTNHRGNVSCQVIFQRAEWPTTHGAMNITNVHFMDPIRAESGAAQTPLFIALSVQSLVLLLLII